MTKGEFIELALLEVSGGKLSQDATVVRAELAVRLPAVLAFAMTNAEFQARADGRNEASFVGAGLRTPDAEFYRTVTVTPSKDDVTGNWRIDLPALLDLPNGWNILNMRPAGSFEYQIVRVAHAHMLIGAEDIPGIFAWTVLEGNQTRAYFNRLPTPKPDIVVTAAVSPEALGTDDRLPCPPSVAHLAAQLLAEIYRRQRGMPADATLNDNDINEAAQSVMGRQKR